MKHKFLLDENIIDCAIKSAPPLEDESDYPREDIPIVRAAHHFKALTVTYDEELRNAINGKPFQDIRALHPQEAVEYAEDT